MDRERVLAACVAAADTPRLSVRPWRLEEALGSLARSESRAGMAAAAWVSHTRMGPAAPGLETVLAALHRRGAVVHSPRWRCLVVNPWWREDRRRELMALDPQSRDAIEQAGTLLDCLEGHLTSVR